MTTGDDGITRFLDDAGWGGAARVLLAGDASNRRYDRLTRGADRAVLMVAPPEKGEDIRPFVRVTDILRQAGLSAPAVLAADADAGLLLLEDLGDALMARLAGDAALERQMYGAAVDLLVALGRSRLPSDIPPYDRDTYLREARLVAEWYIPAATGAPLAPSAAAAFDTLIARACAPAARDTLVLRDYHSENLIWLPERDRLCRVGLLDYQDALAGDAAYDLVSLLEDARREVSADLQEEMLNRFITATGAPEPQFRAIYAALGAQRNLKIIGIFVRLWRRDGKQGYLDYIPRVWAYLQRDLAHPALADLRRWVGAHVPAPDPAVIGRIRQADHAA